MQISYINKKLAKLLGSQKEVLRTYGPDNGKRILRRLDQIAAADNLQELSTLPQTRVHELTQNRDEQISVDVKHPYRLLMVPNHKETPRKPDGGLEWSLVTQVTILGIEDTH
jgi:plasmid maintenance system killer protein